jgi:hypothetical protein
VGGTPEQPTYTPRPHGNHNPQHGGTFFMAPDNWHHVEGAYPAAGLFRLYLYDDYSKPLPAAELRRAAAHVETDRAVPLVVAANGQYLEARVASATLPARMTAKVRFKPGGPEHRFDFEFAALTDDNSPQPRAAAQTAATGSGSPSTDLHALARQIADAIARRAYGEIWVPALQAKDAALAIEDGISGPRKEPVSVAVREVVRSAWMLDAAGDVGDAHQIEDAHARFVAAMGALDIALNPKARR